jgi:hypothetical protein
MNGVKLSQNTVRAFLPPAFIIKAFPVFGPEALNVAIPVTPNTLSPVLPWLIITVPLPGPPAPSPGVILIFPPVPDVVALEALKVMLLPFPEDTGGCMVIVLLPGVKIKSPDPVIFPNLSILNNVEDPLVSENEAVLTFTEADTLPLVIWNKFNPATFEEKINDAVCAFEALRAYDADTALLAQLAVPNNEPVTLAFEPDTIMASALYCPILTVVSEKASITGIPEMSFTANNDPDS